MECGWDGGEEVTKERRPCTSCGLAVHSGDIARCRMNRAVSRQPSAVSQQPYIETPRVLVGSALKSLIAWFGEIPGGACGGCSRLAAKMDSKGPEWCHDHRASIVAEMVARRPLLEEALRQHAGHLVGSLAGWIPDAVLRVGAGLLLSRAIETATARPVLPGGRVVAPPDTSAVGQRWDCSDALIMTAADDKYAPGAYLALATARRFNTVPMVFVSLGCDTDNPYVKRIAEFAEVREFTERGDFDNWQTWWKPRYIEMGLGISPQVIWLDADTVTGGSLETLTRSPVMVPDHGSVVPKGNYNRPAFYTEMPAPRKRWGQQLPCCGILGLSDLEFVREWADAIDFVTARPALRDAVAYFDQGVFQDLFEGEMLDGRVWNNFLVDRSHTLEQALQASAKMSVVNHYGGPQKPWLQWGGSWSLVPGY